MREVQGYLIMAHFCLVAREEGLNYLTRYNFGDLWHVTTVMNLI